MTSLADFDPIALDELVERAALQTRIDRKYLVPASALGPVLGALDAGTRVLETNGVREFRYESVYFDTPELTSYWMAARPRRRRFKARTRSYLDSASSYLEVKTRGARAATVKERLAYDFGARDRLSDEGLGYVGSTLADSGFAEVEPTALGPTLVTRYRRATLLVPGSGGDPARAEAGACPRVGVGVEAGESRATIDTELDWDDGGRRMRTPGLVIVETKSGSRASAVDRALWAHGLRPSTISKYATGLAALRPELASNRWSRVLRRHFAR